ncbi:MAG: 6-hydroxymethylpterin diphosphokinase MptE-like protein [Treponema sp.]
MAQSQENNPCLAETAQGFSVKYKGRFLYSKYNPQAAILRAVSQLQVLPDTLILCCSPCLCYGVQELAAALPENCLLVGCERDERLFSFAQKYARNLECRKSGGFAFPNPKDLYSLPKNINKYGEKNFYGGRSSFFKRTLRLDFSAGAALHSDFYSDLFRAVQDSIGRFWKNRLTLIKFGRRYSRNFFLNLSKTAFSCALPVIRKPILVAGAGEGLERTAAELLHDERLRKSFFIIAVDAAVPALKEAGIAPDALVCEESQSVIAGAFAGCKNACGYAFLSLSSCYNSAAFAAKKSCFYATEFEDRAFIRRLRDTGVLPPLIPPLGSVGLSALYLAAELRADSAVPIFVTGLDFSYSIGKTHACGSFHDRIKRSRANRLHYMENLSAAFAPDAQKIAGKDRRGVVSTLILLEYARIFKAYFSSRLENCFDAGLCGLDLGLPRRSLKCAADTADDFKQPQDGGHDQAACSAGVSQKERLLDHFTQEKAALERLKLIFTGEAALAEQNANAEIETILSAREYLFLHFPDGTKPRLDADFLKRVRTQIDYFLKIFGICIRNLQNG